MHLNYSTYELQYTKYGEFALSPAVTEETSLERTVAV